MQYLLPNLDQIIEGALQEDIGHQDMTTFHLVPREQQARGAFYVKNAGILAGLGVAREVLLRLDRDLMFEVLVEDGSEVNPGDQVATVTGSAAALLTGERVALNFMQRLSGIATKTRAMVESIKYYKAQVVDTRKTTPGLRVLEKYAVRVGGARNHRFGLYDGVMIKDNHIKAAGGIQKAVSTLRQNVPHTMKIEVEVEDFEQLQEALEAGADIILLDNMDPASMKKAVEIAAGKAIMEASGGITEETLVEVAKTGVDFISIGALTHSAPSLDISFELLQIF